MILAIELLDGSVQNIDVGDLSSATMDEKTEALRLNNGMAKWNKGRNIKR